MTQKNAAGERLAKEKTVVMTQKNAAGERLAKEKMGGLI